MSTLVSLLLAAVLNFLGTNIPEETKEVSKNEMNFCENTALGPDIFFTEEEQSIIKHENI